MVEGFLHLWDYDCMVAFFALKKESSFKRTIPNSKQVSNKQIEPTARVKSVASICTQEQLAWITLALRKLRKHQHIAPKPCQTSQSAHLTVNTFRCFCWGAAPLHTFALCGSHSGSQCYDKILVRRSLMQTSCWKHMSLKTSSFFAFAVHFWLHTSSHRSNLSAHLCRDGFVRAAACWPAGWIGVDAKLCSCNGPIGTPHHLQVQTCWQSTQPRIHNLWWGQRCGFPAVDQQVSWL